MAWAAAIIGKTRINGNLIVIIQYTSSLHPFSVDIQYTPIVPNTSPDWLDNIIRKQLEVFNAQDIIESTIILGPIDPIDIPPDDAAVIARKTYYDLLQKYNTKVALRAPDSELQIIKTELITTYKPEF